MRDNLIFGASPSWIEFIRGNENKQSARQRDRAEVAGPGVSLVPTEGKRDQMAEDGQS